MTFIKIITAINAILNMVLFLLTKDNNYQVLSLGWLILGYVMNTHDKLNGDNK